MIFKQLVLIQTKKGKVYRETICKNTFKVYCFVESVTYFDQLTKKLPNGYLKILRQLSFINSLINLKKNYAKRKI